MVDRPGAKDETGIASRNRTRMAKNEMNTGPSTPGSQTRTYGPVSTGSAPFYPRMTGMHCAVATEHYLSARTAARILDGGGNAVDAAVAATLVEGVVNPQMNTLGGECPMLICKGRNTPVLAMNGNTMAPGAATPEAYRLRGLADVPAEGVLAAGVPATLASLVVALKRFGTLSFAEVCSAAKELASNGFPCHAGLIHQPRFGVADLAARFRSEWQASGAVYLPGGALPREGQIILNPALGRVFEHLESAERTAGGSRGHALQAVHDAFYRGDIAAHIVKFVRMREGLLTSEDLRHYEARVEPSLNIGFRDVTVHKCGPWSQGPVMLQALALLDRFPLSSLGHNSTQYIHVVIEAIKLAFADRDQYYADPEQVSVPMKELLAPAYTAARADLIRMGHINPDFTPGDPVDKDPILPASRRLSAGCWGHGTVHIDVIDKNGEMASVTPSGAWLMSSEIIPELGFPLGNRLMTFHLESPGHPNVIAPYKRPRTTLSPTIGCRRGEPWCAFGSMGGDQQDQWMLQFLLNRVVFDMPIQQAIEAPKFSSEHFPGFFAPHDRAPNRVLLEEGRITVDVMDGLRQLGHAVVPVPDWTEGFLVAAERQPDLGIVEAGCDPRGSKSNVFPACALCW